MRTQPLIFASLLLMATLGTAQAQTTTQTPLSERLPNLYFDEIAENLVVVSIVLGRPVDITPERLTNQLAVSAYAVNGLLGNQLSSFPLGSSAGGFSWTFDPAVGTFSRASESFGPTFAERALTVGKGRFNVGLNFQRATFDKMQGKSLSDEEIKIYTGDEGSGIFFETGLNLKVSTNTMGLFANYGVTDRLDLGVAIPIVSVDMEASLVSRAGIRPTGVFPNATPFTTSTSGSASGVGDIVVRGKYGLVRRPGGGLAVGVDARLPTGDELELLGVAGSQTKVYVAASSAFNRFSPHFNFGVTISGESDAAKDPDTFVLAPPNELNFVGGVDFAATPRATVVFDVVGRTLRDFGRLEEIPTEFGSNYRELTLADGNLNVLLGAAGVKYNPWANMLVSANVLFPLRNNGLTDNLTWLVGFEYSFDIGSR
jgi:hypothetical protein